MSKKVRVAIYIRVSTQGQNLDGQENELKQYAKIRGWEISRTYRDKISGTTSSRPALDELMADARKGLFHCVAVWKFDRFGRSLRNLLTALEEFKRLKIDFVSATEGIDTTTPGGELAFQIFGAMAQWERSLLSDRVKSGLSEALRKGKTLGRPAIKTLTLSEVKQVRADRATGKFTLRALAAKYRTSVWAMQQATLGQKGGYEN